VQALGLELTTLAAVRNHAVPATEVARGGKAINVAYVTGVNGPAKLSNAIQRLQVAGGMELAIERADGVAP
jgi:hypothetical protein